MGYWNFRVWRQREGLTLRETYYNDAKQLYAATEDAQVGPAKNLDDLRARVRNLGDSAETKRMMLRDIERFKGRILHWPRRRWAKRMFTRGGK